MTQKDAENPRGAEAEVAALRAKLEDLTRENERLSRALNAPGREFYAELQEYKARLELTLDSARMGIWDWDIANDKRYFDEQVCRLLGFKPSEFNGTGQELLAAVHPDDHEIIHTTREQSFQHDKPYRMQYRAVWPDGSIHHLAVRGNLIRDNEGNPQRMLGILWDITDCVETEESLQKSLSQHRTLFDHMAQGVFYQNADGSLDAVNDAALEIFGLTREEFMGRTSFHPRWEVIREDGTPIPAAEHPSMIALRSGKPVRDEIVAVFNPLRNQKVWVVVNAIPEFLPGETRPCRVAVTLHDITERKHVEQIMQSRLRLLDFASGHSLDELLQATLDEAEALTGSQIGFFHFLETDQKTLSLQMWSTNTLNTLCTAAGKGSHYPVEQAGVWVDCVRQRRPVIHNDYASLPNRKGLPPGHAPVVRELVVPVLRDDEIVAILGVGNKPSDYSNDDLFVIQMLAELAWEIVEAKRAEEALVESEFRYHTVADFTYDWEYWENPDGSYRYISPACERITGYRVEDFLQDQGMLDRIILAEDRKIWKNHHHEETEVRSSQQIVFRIQRKDGEIRWIEHACQPVIDNRGKFLGYRASNRDVTGRQQAEEALKQSALALNKAQGVAHMGSWQWYLQDNRLEWSDEMYHIFGLERESFTGKLSDVLTNSIHPDDLAKVEASNRSVLEQAKPVPLAYRIIHSDGTVRWVWAEAGELLLGDDGKPYRLTGIVQDITERKRAEEALKLGYEMFAAAPYTMMLMDKEMRVLNISNAGARAAGRERNELLNLLCGEVMFCLNALGGTVCGHSPACDICPLRSRVNHTMQTGEAVYNAEGRMTLIKDGQPVEMDILISTSIIELDGTERVLVTVADITDLKQAQRALAQSEANMTALIENTEDVLVSRDCEGGAIVFNSAFARIVKRLFGVEARTGIRTIDYLPPGPKEHWEVVMQRVLAGEEYREVFTWDFDRENRIYELSLRPIWVNGEVVGTTEFTRDVTDRKQAEEALRESEERFRLAMDATSDGLYDADMVTGERYFGPSYYHMLGYEVGEFEQSKQAWLDLMHPEDRGRLIKLDDDCIHNRISVLEAEFRMRAKNGEWKWIYGRGKAVARDENGKALRIVGTQMDITGRKQMEEALRESEERFRLAMDATSDGLYDANIVTGERYFSPRYYQMLGYEVGEFDQSEQAWLDMIHPDDRAFIIQINEDYIHNRIPVMEGEYRMRARNGEWRWIYGRGKAVARDEQGKPLRIIGTHMDITERKKMEKALIEAEKLAGIGTLAAGIAHEINTPLQIITGVSETIQSRLQSGNEIDREDLTRRMENINANAWRIARIVLSLLDYARSPAEQVNEHSLNEIVERTLVLTEHQFRSWSNIAIVTDLAQDLPPVQCDAHKITQVLVNLLTNARDAMPQGGQITVSTAYDAEESLVVLRVIDTGTGIPEELQGKIFDPFFTTKEVGKGSGLGLSISTGILQAHGGRLEVERSGEKGSVFKLTLPVRR